MEKLRISPFDGSEFDDFARCPDMRLLPPAVFHAGFHQQAADKGRRELEPPRLNTGLGVEATFSSAASFLPDASVLGACVIPALGEG